jgi:hypothetical protein
MRVVVGRIIVHAQLDVNAPRAAHLAGDPQCLKFCCTHPLGEICASNAAIQRSRRTGL